jgi:hypothetical protein
MSLSVADLTTLAPLKTAEDNATKLQTLANSLGAAFQSVTKDLRDLNEADNSTTRQGAASRLLADLAAVKSLQVNDDTVSLGGNSDPAATAAALRKRDSELQAFSLSDAMKQVSRINLSQSEAQAVGTETSHEMQHDTIAAANSSKIEWYAQLMASFNTISKSAQVLAANCTVLGTVVGDWHEARTVGLQLQSAAASDPTNFQTVGTGVTLVMGQPVFAISGGFAISPLAKTTFQTLGASSSGSSGSSSGTIGLQENSSTRVQPMAFINASLVDGTTSWLKGSLHMTAGFTLTNNQLSTNPEFLFGPSLSFLRERLFFTGGVYGGFQQSLQAGYTLGGPAPSGTIPTVNQFHWRPGFAISWRVVSASKTNDNSSTTNPKTASQNPTTAKPKTGGGTGGGN